MTINKLNIFNVSCLHYIKYLNIQVKNKLEGCTYEGRLENDPNSTVSMTNCDVSL